MGKLTIVVFILVALSILYSCENEEKLNTDTIDKKGKIKLNEIYSLSIAENNHFLIAGKSDSKVTFIMLNEHFKTIWKKDNYKLNHYENGWGGAFYNVEIIDIFQNTLGNFICIGAVTEGSGCIIKTSTLIVVLNKKGKRIREIEYEAFDVKEAIHIPANGYVLLGKELVKLNSNLEISWKKSYSGNKVINTKDGSYTITGSCEDKEHAQQIFLRKIDKQGKECWRKVFTSPRFPSDNVGFGLIQVYNRDFIIAGRTRNDYEPYDLDGAVIRTNNSGDTIWTRKFGKNTNEWLYNFVYSSDDQFIIQGKEGFPNDSIQRSILIKMNTKGQILDSSYLKRFELLPYNSQANCFIMGYRSEESTITLSKVPFNELFN